MLRHTKRAGRPLRGIALLVVGVLAWKWALIAFVAQVIVKLIRSGDGAGDATEQPQ